MRKHFICSDEKCLLGWVVLCSFLISMAHMGEILARCAGFTFIYFRFGDSIPLSGLHPFYIHSIIPLMALMS